MRVAIVHYHLRRGGVTRVIENAVAALAERDVETVVLCGEPYEGDKLSNTVCVEGLAYAEEDAAPNPERLMEELVQAAESALGGPPDLWHVHNHSLGKNPSVPETIHRMAKAGHHLLLQIHDFAEDGRPANYERIQSVYRDREDLSARHLYPVAPHVHYAVLNGRDCAFLHEAGLDEEQLHLLANPVAVPELEDNGDTSDVFPGGQRVIVYPTRGIRRKNMGEILMLAALHHESAVFVSTLKPENPEWIQIHENWERLAEAHGLPVVLGAVSDELHSFDSLILRADALVTTSVAEGFGLAFLEPWLFGKTVLGRDLPDITRDFKDHGVELSRLYTRLPVPIEWVGGKDAITRALEPAMEQAYRNYKRELPADAVERAFNSLHDDGFVDFGQLDETLQQRAIVTAVESQEACAQVKCPEFAPVPDEQIEANRRKICEAFSIESYGEQLAALYDRVVSAETPDEIDSLDPGRVLDAFLSPERFCLLRS